MVEEKESFLLTEIRRENEARIRALGSGDINHIDFNKIFIWSYVDDVYEQFLDAVEKKNEIEAKNLIETKKQILHYFYDQLHKLYEIINLSSVSVTGELKEKDETEESRVNSLKEKRRGQIDKARKMISQYLKYVEELEKNLDTDPEALKHLGTFLYLANERAYASSQIIDATLDRTCRILEMTKEKGPDEYPRQIEELRRKAISALTRYISSLEASKEFDRIHSSEGEVFGVHGEYYHDYLGEGNLTLGFCEPIIFNITLMDLGEKDLENLNKKIEDVAKEYKLSDEMKNKILGKVKGATDLLKDFYGLSNIDSILIDANMLYIIAKERGKYIKEFFKRGKCHAIPLFLIHTYEEPYFYQIVDILVRFESERLGSPITLKEQVELAGSWYLSKYSSVINEMAKAVVDLKDSIKLTKDVIQYQTLLNYLEKIDKASKEFLTPSGILLIAEDGKPYKITREEFRKIIKNIKSGVEEYRKNRIFPDGMEEDINRALEYTKRAFNRAKEAYFKLKTPKKTEETLLYL
ncbi:MAG: hypothetical protein QW423_00205 [Candidatus Aenigmatarchaeota archaeon]